MQTTDRPFRQGSFAELPESPRVPHGYGALVAETLTLPLADLGPTTWTFRKVGEGPPLLLVHGLMTTGYSWRYVLPELARHWTVFVPDLPGSGASVAPEGRLLPGRMAEGLAALIGALGMGPIDVIGNSMGGYLALHLAHRRPDLMKHLVVLHAPGFVEARLWALWLAMRLPGAAHLLGGLVAWNPLRWAHRNVHYYDESLKSLEEAREYGLPLLSPQGRSGFFRQLRDMMDVREMRPFHLALARAGGIRAKTMLLYARTDPMVPPWMGPAWQALLPTAELTWAEEGSHFLHVDRPERFLAASLPFLRDQGD